MRSAHARSARLQRTINGGAASVGENVDRHAMLAQHLVHTLTKRLQTRCLAFDSNFL